MLSTSSWKPDIALGAVADASAKKPSFRDACGGVRAFVADEPLGFSWRPVNTAPIARQAEMECLSNGSIEMRYTSDSQEELNSLAELVQTIRNAQSDRCGPRCIHFTLRPQNPLEEASQSMIVLAILGFGLAL